MPSSFTPFSLTKPAGTSTGTVFATDANSNDVALACALLLGELPGWVYSLTAGTGTATQPQYEFLKNGATWLRRTNTWGASGGGTGNIVGVTLEYSSDSGATWASIYTAGARTYDSGGNLTATSGGGGLLSRLESVWGHITGAAGIISSFVAHAAAVVASGVHGLGSIASQAANAVAITGGAIANVVLSYTYARGKVVNAGNLGLAYEIDWQSGDVIVGTVNTNLVFSEINRPGNAALTQPAGSITLRLINPGAFAVTWPTTWKWPNGVTPARTVSGVDIYEAYCDDGTTVHAAQAQKDTR